MVTCPVDMGSAAVTHPFILFSLLSVIPGCTELADTVNS